MDVVRHRSESFSKPGADAAVGIDPKHIVIAGRTVAATQWRHEMRDLTIDELEHVYGAGGKGRKRKKKGKGKRKGRGGSRSVSRSVSRDVSRSVSRS